MPGAVLTRHPAFPTEVVQGVQVDISRNSGATLHFRYILEAHMDRIRVPPLRAAQRKDELWKHTCFEAFVSQGTSGGYYEFNFSPSTEWAMYSFNGYREGMASVTPIERDWLPRVSVRQLPQGLELEAVVHLASMPLVPADATLRLAPSAIIEEEGDELSYWALNHPSGHPDFHNAKSLGLEI